MGKIKKAPAPAAQTMFYNVDLLDSIKRREEVRNNFMNGVTFSNNLKKNATYDDSVLQKKSINPPITTAQSLRVNNNRLKRIPIRNPTTVRKDGSVKLRSAIDETFDNPLIQNRVTVNPQAELRDSYSDIGGLGNHLSVMNNLPTRSTDINNANLLLGKNNLNEILKGQSASVDPKNDRLNTMTLEKRDPGSRDYNGMYYNGQNKEYVSGENKDDMTSTALHELTHGRQDAEGTLKNYNVAQPWASRPKEIHAIISAAKQRGIRNGLFKNTKDYEGDINLMMTYPHIRDIRQELYKKYNQEEADQKIRSLFKVIAKKDSNTDSDNLV